MEWLRFLRQNGLWLGAGGLLTFLSGFGQTFFIAIFAGEIREDFGLTNGQWGGIYTLGTACSAVLMVWAGGLTDRFRVRRLGPVVLVGLALACLAMAFNTSVLLLPLVIFALRFFGQGMTSHIAVVAMSRWFVATRGRALAIATLGFSVAEAVLPLTFVALMARVDWRWLWVAGAVVVLCGVPMLLAALRHERTPQSLATQERSAGMRGEQWTRGAALGHPLFWLLVPALLGPPAFGTAFFFHQVHFAAVKGWEHVALVALFPVYTLSAVGAMILSGWALDRWGTARLMPWIQLPMVVAFAVFAGAGSLGAVAAGLVAMAMTTGANATLMNAFWAEFYGTAHLGAIKAMAAAVMVLGSALGPGITGALIDLGVGIEAQYGAVAGYFLGTTVCLWMGIRRYAGSVAGTSLG
ncbi:MAG: MFS transporter [Pseudooceanicola sp.]|nr:MFS transporter [Pseudooceanicola sp.]